MKGWTPVKAKVTSNELNKVVDFFKEEGFEVNDQGQNHYELLRKGTELTLKGEKFPLFLLAIGNGKDTALYLRYAAFAFSDTGDLERYMENCLKAINNR